MFKSIVSKIAGDPAQRTMSKYQAMVDEICSVYRETPPKVAASIAERSMP